VVLAEVLLAETLTLLEILGCLLFLVEALQRTLRREMVERARLAGADLGLPVQQMAAAGTELDLALVVLVEEVRLPVEEANKQAVTGLLA
jgi:hypothetical protein